MAIKRTGWAICGLVFLMGLASLGMQPTRLGSEFTYQGNLKLLGEALNDTADFEFSLYDAEVSGNFVSLVPVDNVTIVDGLFTVQLDFGVMPFNGDALWLEIAVRSPAGDGAFTTLSDRQPLSATPYALQTRGIFVDGDLNVGIGTISPAAKLDIEGSVRIADGNQGAGRVLTSDANGVGMWQPPAGGGGFSNMQVYSTPGKSEFIVPAGVTKVMVEVRGGGGGGGKGNAGGGAVGQGGSGGGYGMGIFAVSPDSVHNVIVGGGGLGSNGGTCTIGTPGGTSSFGALISATGGGGGGGCGSTSTPGSSTAPLNMTGEEGQQYFSSGSTPENPGGKCGDGSTVGQGGNGNEFFGRDGNSGVVVVFW